jgi:signal-transduction protein with cAMP-binding, CBS, and nucleotidyltransferase domain
MTTTQAGPPQHPLPPERETTTAARKPSSGSSPVGDFLLPLYGRVLASEGVDTALQHMEAAGVECLVITDPEDGPLGLITRDDIEQLQWKHPDLWSAMRCGNVVVAPSRFIHAHETFAAAAEILKSEGVRPLLVLESGNILGVLEPTAVFQWCAEHQPTFLEELAELAREAEAPYRQK